MQRILLANEKKQADQDTICRVGIPSMVLMERAALTVTEEICSGAYDLREILVVCGTGNNGGDGVACARQLLERGLRVRVCCIGSEDKRSEDLRKQLDILRALGVPVETSFSAGEATLLVDALFGIGLTREVQGEAAEVIRQMNSAARPIVAVDLPSGVHPDTGQILGEAVRAACTVTFTAALPGLYLPPGAIHSGRVLTRRIGMLLPEERPSGNLYAVEDADLGELTAREAFGNKGTFGKVLVLAGSAEICGAAYLAARSALVCGAGMVRILTHENNREPLARMFPEALLTVYDENSDAEERIKEAVGWADVCVAGPGLGTGPLSRRILDLFLRYNRLPAVLDADALNLLAEDPSVFRDLAFPCVITPHIGEMSRLTGAGAAAIKADPVRSAAEAAERWKVVVVQKDARTVTAFPEGDLFLNLSGNSALATAGSGDVLAGLIGGLLAQRRSEGLAAVPLAVYLHGKCGESAASVLGKAAVTASDLIPEIHKFM